VEEKCPSHLGSPDLEDVGSPASDEISELTWRRTERDSAKRRGGGTPALLRLDLITFKEMPDQVEERSQTEESKKKKKLPRQRKTYLCLPEMK